MHVRDQLSPSPRHVFAFQGNVSTRSIGTVDRNEIDDPEAPQEAAPAPEAEESVRWFGHHDQEPLALFLQSFRRSACAEVTGSNSR